MTARLRMLMAGAAMVALGAAGCGGDSEAASDGGQGGGGGQPALTIDSPKNGANVQAPVKLQFSTSSEIGKEETGKNHVHVILDGKTDDYTVVTSKTHEIKNLPAGQHTIGVTLQHADHSPVGPKAEVTVNVTGAGQPSTSPSQDDDGYGGGYGGGGYGY